VVIRTRRGSHLYRWWSRASTNLKSGPYTTACWLILCTNRLSEREHFGYYPVILGDLEGGSKERKDFPDIVRITAELLGGLSALERTPDLRVLMFHGPLVYLMSGYSGHTPFIEKDIDLFLRQYAPTPESGRQIKEDFLRQAELDIYPQMTDRSDEWIRRRLFEPLAWIAYLYRRLICVACQRKPTPIIAGVVERGTLREFSEKVLLERVFRGLRMKGNVSYFNNMYGRSDLTSPQALLDRLGYTDALLLAMLLQPSQVTESWEIGKYDGLHPINVSLPGEAHKSPVNYARLQPSPIPIGFPRVRGCYVHISETTEPVRVEVFDELGPDQIVEAARRTYMYARLLPGYGFPVGLDIADKHAHVPAWLTNAYGKLIRHHLGVSLQQGEISDADMRRILVQAIYMTHRDWLFRPKS
jgi:NurA domain-containing protein